MLVTPNTLVSMLSQGTFTLGKCAVSILNKVVFFRIQTNLIEHILTAMLCHQKHNTERGGKKVILLYKVAHVQPSNIKGLA